MAKLSDREIEVRYLEWLNSGGDQAPELNPPDDDSPGAGVLSGLGLLAVLVVLIAAGYAISKVL